ncbi:MAG: carbamoyl-phosphate synthase large subunit [Rhizobiales bacterium 68-8]|nr:MAG: carbamoyl-phosphate synthase large subunit [Rhizobiales bacterium 68-8]
MTEPTLEHLLIANRGEIAIRIARAASELGIATTAIHSQDDAASLHLKSADSQVALAGNGVPAYLDIEQIVRVAREAGCDAVHPGYGFLAENAEFARRCAEEGIVFVGPTPELLELFGDKIKARAFAERHGVPLLPGTGGDTMLDEAKAFFASLGEGGAMMVKAVAGGGGRGMRAVRRQEDVGEAYERCRSEAQSAFGNPAVYVERLIDRARHIEVQIIGDGKAVSHAWERDCTLQRRNQKIVEIAPSPTLAPNLRTAIIGAARTLAKKAGYRSLGTFEFLVDADAPEEAPFFAFMEANPRVQVEHTVTEEVTGIDLVKSQLQIAAGMTLKQLGLTQPEIGQPRGYAIQLRINMEVLNPDGSTKPAGGTLNVFEPPSGPGIRVDTFGYAGYTTVPRFDSLLAKLIVHAPGRDYADAVRRAERALSEFRIDGVATNIPVLQNLLQRPEFVRNDVTTRFVETHAADLSAADPAHHRKRYFDVAGQAVAAGTEQPAAARAPERTVRAPANARPFPAPLQGTVLSVEVAEGALVHPGQTIAIMEAMKMEHVVAADKGGYVRRIAVAPGTAVLEGETLFFLEEAEVEGQEEIGVEEAVDLDTIRPDLAATYARHAFTLDENRPAAVAKRHKIGKRTARENIAHLVDPGSFVEYGPLIVAAQRRRRGMEDLIANTPADGLVTGIGTVNADRFGEQRARCMVMSYDYTVLAGTQGLMNHKKKDRLLHLCEQWNLPLILFGEGGGGRPGDVDMESTGLECPTFHGWARLSGRVPLVAIVSGRCYAGNAALVGCCDVIIATRDTNLGMGGPAMIEGGGLGVVRPEDIGPIDVQTRNGVVDIAVEDEAEAVEVARKYIAYFQGPIAEWECADQRTLRSVIPENRLRAYDIRAVISALADKGSVLELRRDFGVGIVTALIRIEGRPLGLIANNPRHLGGAIDAEAADKASRFMQLCNAFDIPILNLCDTPGFMVGPEIEKQAQVRRVSQMFVVGANCSVPIFTVVLRKAYGLGALGMAGGGFHVPMMTISWPTGELGGMGLEGAVRLAYKKELEAIKDPVEQKAWFDRQLAAEYELGKAFNAASYFQIDAVIDPAETRRWILRGLASVPPVQPRTDKKQPFVSVW